MAIPKHDKLRLPILQHLNQFEQRKLKEFEIPIAQHFQLTEDEINQEYASGNGKILYDRISWALSYLNMAGLVQKPKRGIYQMSSTGIEQLKKPNSLNGYITQKIAKRTPHKKISVESKQEQTPREELANAYQIIREARYNDILDTILNKTPRDFEKLVVELLQKMGYGGAVKTAGQVTQYTNDKGIDGIIKEDVLGLGRIYIQAKRYARDNVIPRQDVQKFVGALAVAQSNKGVFITTSYYSKGAIEYAENLNGTTTLVLIDGEKLAEYIYDYGLGMQTKQILEIKELDSDYWEAMDDDSK
ncbi:MAG: restriction endonuclease [Cocleimonas sp.]|nr:restriction endonuclease [Cocleimonas sp.]